MMSNVSTQQYEVVFTYVSYQSCNTVSWTATVCRGEVHYQWPGVNKSIPSNVHHISCTHLSIYNAQKTVKLSRMNNAMPFHHELTMTSTTPVHAGNTIYLPLARNATTQFYPKYVSVHPR